MYAALDTVDIRNLGPHYGRVLEALVEHPKPSFGVVSWILMILGGSDLLESDSFHGVVVNGYLILTLCAGIDDGEMFRRLRFFRDREPK